MQNVTHAGATILFAIGLEAALVAAPCNAQLPATSSPLRLRAGWVREHGVILHRSDIERWTGRTTTELMARVPGVRVVKPDLAAGRGLTPGRSARTIRMARAPEACFPLVVVDDVRFGSAPDLDLDVLISPADLDTVKVYRSATEAPPGLAALGQCGVIVFRTRRTR